MRLRRTSKCKIECGTAARAGAPLGAHDRPEACRREGAAGRRDGVGLVMLEMGTSSREHGSYKEPAWGRDGLHRRMLAHAKLCAQRSLATCQALLTSLHLARQVVQEDTLLRARGNLRSRRRYLSV